ncbi:MAG: hypothetical protein EOM41_00690 [Bacilli bacterium]|nr:hypothetical protein [Bacilli bacterium]
MFYIAASVQNVYPRPAFAPHTMHDVVSFIFANKDKLVSFEASLANKFEYQYSFDFSTATYAEFEKANYIPAAFMWDGKEVTENEGTLEISGSFFTEDRFMGSVGNKPRWGALRDSNCVRFTNMTDLLFWLASNAKGTLNLTFKFNTNDVLFINKYDHFINYKKEEKRFTIIL